MGHVAGHSYSHLMTTTTTIIGPEWHSPFGSVKMAQQALLGFSSDYNWFIKLKKKHQRG